MNFPVAGEICNREVVACEKIQTGRVVLAVAVLNPEANPGTRQESILSGVSTNQSR